MSHQKKKEKVMHSSTVRKMEKGVEEEQVALVTPWQPLALLCGSPYALRVGRRCEKASCDFTGAASRCPPKSDWPPERGRSPL